MIISLSISSTLNDPYHHRSPSISGSFHDISWGYSQYPVLMDDHDDSYRGDVGIVGFVHDFTKGWSDCMRLRMTEDMQFLSSFYLIFSSHSSSVAWNPYPGKASGFLSQFWRNCNSQEALPFLPLLTAGFLGLGKWHLSRATRCTDSKACSVSKIEK